MTAAATGLVVARQVQWLHWPPFSAPSPGRGIPSVRLESNKNEYFSRHQEYLFINSNSIFQVRRTFSTPSWRDHHDTWKEQRYNWLPSWKEIPKHLHDPLDSGHLQKLSVSNIFLRRPPRSDTFYCFYENGQWSKAHRIIGFLLHEFKIPQLLYDCCFNKQRTGFLEWHLSSFIPCLLQNR